MLLKNGKPYGFFFNAIKWKVLAVIVLTLAVGYLDDYLYTIFDFDLAIPAFFGTAIVLSLAFRTNKAYNRWWEAKMIWESIINDSRSWTRMVLKFLGNDQTLKESPTERQMHLINRQVAWNYILVNRLREKELLKDQEKFLTPSDINFLKGVDNPTQGILFLQSRDLMDEFRHGRLDVYLHVEMEEILRRLEASMGKAERIKKTHFPVLYDYLFEISIYLFCAFLTYAIRDSTTVFEAAFSIIITTLFLMINEIGRDMQDPFEDLPTDTPMLALSHQFERSALQLTGVEEMPEARHHGKYYIK